MVEEENKIDTGRDDYDYPLDPDGDETATVTCGTSKGRIVIEFYRHWSPYGYDRVVNLFEMGYYDSTHFFRCIHGFLVQFGISYTKDKQLLDYASKTIPDDPQLEPHIKFQEGTISFAGSGPSSRDTQIFIAYGAIPSLGRELWETPLGSVIEGMEYVKEFYGGYGDDNGPLQNKITNKGIDYIKKDFPLLDHFLLCTVTRRSMDDDQDDPSINEKEILDDIPNPAAIIPQKENNKQLRADAWNVKNADGVVMKLDDRKLPSFTDNSNIWPAGVLLLFILFILFLIRNRNKSTGKQE